MNTKEVPLVKRISRFYKNDILKYLFFGWMKSAYFYNESGRPLKSHYITDFQKNFGLEDDDAQTGSLSGMFTRMDGQWRQVLLKENQPYFGGVDLEVTVSAKRNNTNKDKLKIKII